MLFESVKFVQVARHSGEPGGEPGGEQQAQRLP